MQKKMQENVKKDKVNSISDILEEIVTCVTAPSFCVMPWKCVTMAVGDRTDPLVKKSVVHIYRTCVDGQNIFQIKVHNCKKDVCDHAICTKDCETTRQTNTQSGKEAMRNEINKKKRKKRNKYSDGNKETMLGCCIVNKVTADEHEKVSSSKEQKDSKHRNGSTQKNKRNTKKSENKEKPSCTLQLFAEGKSRKLNFQLHPAMKVFLGKALDRIEGRDTKGRRTNSPSSIRPNESCHELLRKTNDSYKSKIAKTMKTFSPTSQCCNKNIRTESVEEFEINLPDKTSHAKDYLDDPCIKRSLSDISGLSCHCDMNQIPEDIRNNRFCSEMKNNLGYLLNNIIPLQQSRDGKEKSDKETPGVRTELHLGPTPEKFNNEQLKTDNTHKKTIEGCGINHNHNGGRLVVDEERFHSQDRHHLTFQDHQPDTFTSKYENSGVKTMLKQNQTDNSMNISCGNETHLHSYTNSSQCFQNRTRDNIIRTPYVVDYHSDNNELLVNDIRNINNRSYSISDNRGPLGSTDYINNTSIYRNNTGIYSPPIVHDTFSGTPEYGTFLTNDGVYSNRFYDSRQYRNFPNHGRDSINMRIPPTQHYKIPYNQHDLRFPKENTDHETQMYEERENRKECRRVNRYPFSNSRDINIYPKAEKRMFFRETNKPEPRKHSEDIPTSDRSHNNIQNRIRNVNDYDESIDNYPEEKRTFDRQRHDYNRTEERGGDSETRTNHRSNKPNKRKDWKESEKSNSNRDSRKPGNSTGAQYHNHPSCSSIIESKTSSNKQNTTKMSNTDKNSSGSSDSKENKQINRGAKKNRKEKNNTDKHLIQNTNKILQNANPSTHSNYKLINKPRTQYENEEEHFFERQKNIRKFKHIRPSKIASEERVKNKLKRNNTKTKTDNANISNTNDIYHRKTSKESHLVTKRTPSIETTDSCNYLAQEVYINDASEKSSDILSFCYHFPEDYSSYQFFKPDPNKNGKKPPSREKINYSKEGLCIADYETDSKFFCYPSQISWNHYENLQQIIPNINQQHYLNVKNTRSEKKTEPSQNIPTEGESSKLCRMCCKALNEDKPGKNSLDDSHTNKYETRNDCSKNLTKNNTQYKGMTNVVESCRSKNDLVPNKDMRSSNLNDVRNPINSSLPNAVLDTNQFGQNNNVERTVIKSNIVDSKDLKEQNAAIKSENLQKKQSKTLHSQSVKKFFSHAKEYLNFRKYSTSSLRSGLSNGLLQVGPSHCTSQPAGAVTKVEDHPCIDSKHSEPSENKRNGDFFVVNKKQCSNPEAKACLYSMENNIDGPQLADIQGKLGSAFKPTEAFRNNTALAHNYPDTKTFKLGTYANSQANLKDEKYRLYGSNDVTMDRSSMEDDNIKCIKNEYKILQSESECEGFSDDMYCYSSSEWQSEVAKNWVAKTRKKYIKHDNRIKVSLKKTKSNSAYSLRSDFSNRKVEKCESNNNKPTINATIALSADRQKRKENKLELEGQFQVNPYSKQKSDHIFSNLFSNSIKNNYKKIKGLVKRNHTHQKNKSPTRVFVLNSPSYTDTQSQSILTPVTSTYIANKSVDTTVMSENTTTIKNYSSDSNYIKSDPIIRKIVPATWQKFVSRRISLQSTEEVSETDNSQSENSSMSDVSIEESRVQSRSNKRVIQPFARSHGFKYSKKIFSECESSVQQRGFNIYQKNQPVPYESMDEYNQSVDSMLNNCFQNPMVDPKTGFRPLLPT